MSDPKTAGAKYASDYGAWDLWIYAHARDTADPGFTQLANTAEREGWQWLDCGVDKQGNMVPYLKSYGENLALQYGAPQDAKPEEACAFSIIALGPMDDKLLGQLIAARSELRAPYTPPVPRWLATAPPRYAVLLPDGRVAALGALGCGRDCARLQSYGRPESSAEGWTLYSPEGDPLAAGEPGGQWWHLSFPDYQQQLGLADLSVQCWEWNGVINVYNSTSYEFKGLYKYDGTRLDDAAAASQQLWTGKGLVEGFDGAELLPVYRAQQRR